MKELSLFSGAGGGLLGSKLLGWTTIGYVEWNDYCQRIIRQRIEDGILDNAPIFGDIRAFNDQYAERYRGLVDVVTGGFPCQPFSIAGKQLGANDPRNMWPETIRTIRTVQPRFAFLENVPGLLRSGYFGTVIGELSEIGYNAKWCIVSAADTGAPHKRDRLWILAYPKLHSNSWRRAQETKARDLQIIDWKERCARVPCGTSGKSEILANTNSTYGKGNQCTFRSKETRTHTFLNSWWAT